MRTLIGLPYSPWTLKARWALAHHGVEHRFGEYLPMLGAFGLRIRRRRFRGRVTVPVLIAPEGIFDDSFEIARFAESIGTDKPLLPEKLMMPIRGWNARADELCEAGRVRSSRLALESKQALLESIPSTIPRSLRSMMLPVARRGARYLLGKYDDPGEGAMDATLDAARKALGGKADRFLLGEPSYADIALAVALQFVDPVDARYVALGPSAHAIWKNERLAAAYPDLLAWRDRVFANLNAPTPP